MTKNQPIFSGSAFTGANLLAFLLLIAPLTLSAQVGKVSGRVTDASTGEAIPGANVIIDGTSMGGAADGEGDYFIIRVSPGRYNVTASVIGYQDLTITNILVSSDLTSTVNFEMSSEAVEGEAVTVTAERAVIQMDQSASAITVEASAIVDVPTITDVNDFLDTQVGIDRNGQGIESMVIRGGGVDQIGMQVDGLMLNNNGQNRPMMDMVNLSAIKELTIIKGGFNAEYGNIRSGLISAVTKDGGDTYNASVDFRFTPAQQKHGGKAVTDTMNYFMRPFFDPDVAFVGTSNGGWDEYTQNQYPEWEGWNSWSERLLADEAPGNDQTPRQAQEMFLWQHALIGSERLGQKELDYANKPDHLTDVSISGPVPVVGKMLGGLSFFASFKNQFQMMPIPVQIEAFEEQNAHVKLTSSLGNSIKLKVDYMQAKNESIMTYSGTGGGGSVGRYAVDPLDVMFSSKTSGTATRLWWPHLLTPMTIDRGMTAFTMDHILSPATYYSIKVSQINIAFDANGPTRVRDLTTVRSFGSQTVDEIPYGYTGPDFINGADGALFSVTGSGERDWTEVKTTQIKGDITSQVNKYNQFKAGFEYTMDDLQTHFASANPYDVTGNFDMQWAQEPTRLGLYLQNKLEFEGMIANFGLRMDQSNPNSEWYTTDVYSKYFSKKYRDNFQEVAPTEATKTHTRLSPRLGISHPITASSKMYFNYGHFYSMPLAENMYTIRPGSGTDGITNLGNPSAEPPRSISYELGYEQDFSDMYYVHLAGYYKDVTGQTGEVQYINYDRSVNYTTYDNNFYADVRGLEIRVDKRFGKYFTGWFNYDYRVETSGFVGREVNYEDPREQALYGLYNPYQERPLARPLARANIRFRSPDELGLLGGFDINFLWSWKAGRYETWDPLIKKLQDNIQWKGENYTDLRFAKQFLVGGASLYVFADIKNLFNQQFVSDLGFAPGDDRRAYLGSLKLPMYDDPEYKAAGFTGGTDRVGDVRSSEKDYIDMPNRGLFTYLNPRTFLFGIKINI
ncbi:MAG: hypothetical protein CMG75_01250 [Candidatus Marinimicrobia bacterium]|nr:hypothetical protein [Candidatus Neomarinimicrobiota bacterium]